MLLKKCQEEFYNFENTTLKSNFFYQRLSRSEEKENLNRIKIGNINLIGELYINNYIQVKIIQECVDHMISNLDEDKVIYLTELTKKIYDRLEIDDPSTLDKIVKSLESFMYFIFYFKIFKWTFSNLKSNLYTVEEISVKKETENTIKINLMKAYTTRKQMY